MVCFPGNQGRRDFCPFCELPLCIFFNAQFKDSDVYGWSSLYVFNLLKHTIGLTFNLKHCKWEINFFYFSNENTF
ncbi:hypothetical protein JZ751_009245 [Albula glossodonta]|uniref:Uncharacterized protein n=1 Tax=Albula glossodonta TaxID=121402 RepID=A0A8T2N1N5_9TELE|nr:hypothetical protein JZ751_009245 [Albula glossodonta]